jgi:hypothetical protein
MRLGMEDNKKLVFGRNAMMLSLALLSVGCFHYRTEFPAGAPATLSESATSWSFLWGLVQSDVHPVCAANAAQEVTVTSNLAFATLTFITLGLVAPAQVEWRCAKPCPGGL